MAKVFLSAGHGGSDPGAVAYGLKEKNINLQILLACKNELERHGVKVYTSRTKDENDPVGEEVREANKSGADVAASFHTNAGKGDGSESYYYPTSKDGKKLAELCEKHVKAIGQNSRGVKTKNLAFIRDTKMVAVLCECAFVDNNKDNDIIDTVAEQKAFGVAYAKAILEYLGIKFTDGSVPNNPVKPSKPVTPSKPSTGKLESCSGYITIIYGGKEGLSYHKTPDFNSSSVAGTVKKGTVLTVVGKIKADGGTLYKTKAGWYITASEKYVRYSRTTGSGNPTKKPSLYYPKYTGDSRSVDTVLKAIGVPEKFRGSWTKRKPIAIANGISNYKGTTSQNNKLCNLARKGKLKKA